MRRGPLGRSGPGRPRTADRRILCRAAALAAGPAVTSPAGLGPAGISPAGLGPAATDLQPEDAA
ncbi:hypothetical protein ACGF07_12810 [Kitasatospora sp. NPDC048194]|uniref:hypothetical protein n=1 Tax=Kitasatospora sp. NPDC048194 TaxID=3364045 RepID=UPI00371766CF